MHKTAVIFGGTGFIGRQIVQRLAQAGYQIKVPTRAAEAAYALKPLGDVGQIVGVSYDKHDYHTISKAIYGADLVVNCIGILHETPDNQFEQIHEDLAESIATAAAIHNVKRLVHISALGIDTSRSEYAKTKRAGEKRVHKAFPTATILRPSIVFGHDDNLLNRFAQMAQTSPALPLIGGGKTRFQPVYVGDVAQAAYNALTIPTTNAHDPSGTIFELGGPEIVTFKALLEKMLSYTHQNVTLISLPFFIAEMLANILSIVPTPPLTSDQITSLKTDSIVTKTHPTLEDLTINPTHMDAILGQYLISYRPGGRFGV